MGKEDKPIKRRSTLDSASERVDEKRKSALVAAAHTVAVERRKAESVGGELPYGYISAAFSGLKKHKDCFLDLNA
jgi:hypothetical protein